jgi:predicted dehydrogenase
MEISRRDFAKTVALAGLAGATSALGADRVRGVNDRVRLGFIGVGGRGTYLLGVALGLDVVDVPAICDIDAARLDRALGQVEKSRGKRPASYAEGPTDYRRLLARDDLDAVVIATPMQAHAVMSVDALNAKKHVLCEVAAALTLDECWSLVRAAEASGRNYMLAENCCYYRQNLTVLQMVRQGLFGDRTFAECGYVHDCRDYTFEADGRLSWRGELARDLAGNLYPTHALGPVCQWLGINRGDRLVSLVASTSAGKGLAHYVAKKFPADHPARKIKFAVGDTTTTLIRTAKGAVIDLRYDTLSARPHPSTTYYTLQGATASYKDDGTQTQIWLEGKSKSYAWEPWPGTRATSITRCGNSTQTKPARPGTAARTISSCCSLWTRCAPAAPPRSTRMTPRCGAASFRCRRRRSAPAARRRRSRISPAARGKNGRRLSSKEK